MILAYLAADGIDEVGFAQAAAAIHKERVVAFGGVIGYRPGRGVGQAVAAAHHEGLECELRGSEPLTLAVRAVILELCVIQVVQNLHFKIRGENVVKGGLDVFHEPWYDSLVS